MRKLKLALAALPILAIVMPLAALAFVKPLRAAVPGWMPGVQCPRADLCMDDVGRLAEAQQLYAQGYATATAAVGPFHGRPRLVFCSTQACADTFGLGRRAAAAVGDFGLAVAPRGWQSYYVAHELIHYRQAETLGNVAVATGPGWLIEGMAYDLSGDPRPVLGEPFQGWRAQFRAWHAGLGGRDLWEAARAVR
ncbi:hypothetical protein BKK81_12405 [Cupriavidus sp. USMAHM13]|uniref:Transmembrane protein n=1 Tax=Cupriavidus malaysiensis TaxID=367825 RepID=A0ABM6F512_9BURK|nr:MULTISPECIES: hypothetical protein [Cupriavidus]AOY99956.1 hypothetical protein BKK81_12405 [Cupriavidus sp. USMAHM13]AOZ06583.1 hypothetical protein BKK80_12715 [Cupriavidus malaysiensis]